MHQRDGTAERQPYGKDDREYNLSISRFELNKYLIERAAEAGCVLKFGHRLTSCVFQDRGDRALLTFERTDGGGVGSVLRARCDCPIIAADGAGSRMRYAMRDAGACVFRESFCPQGYKELAFPADRAVAGKLRADGLHIWPRDTHFLMALANLDGSFTGTIYVDNEGGDETFGSLRDRESIRAFFERHYADAVPLLGGHDAIARQMLENPVGLLGTVYCDRFHYGRTILVGDAGHAITPFFGQGTNSGFEDTLVLSRLLAREPDVARAFAAFSAARLEDTNAIARMALDNFVEMRERVGDARFLRLKALENALENRDPSRFRSRYAMVCYGGDGGISYSAAFRLGEVQWGVLEELDDRRDERSGEPDWALADRLLRERVDPIRLRLGVDLTKISHDVGACL